MGAINAERPVGQLVAEQPTRARVFERNGIDYCCGGKVALEVIANRKGIHLDTLLKELAAVDLAESSIDETNWTQASLTALTDHIETTHHAYLKEELPRLSFLVDKVNRVHGDTHAELAEVHEVFETFRKDMEQHMAKEELILFPICRSIDSGTLKQSHCGSIRNPIRVMEAEHDAAGSGLERIRELTAGFTPPQDACNTYRVMLDGLAGLEADTHTHVHKENNILFPRATAREDQLTGNTGSAIAA